MSTVIFCSLTGDVLLPLNAIAILSAANLDVISLSYHKKNELCESTTTEIKPDSRDIFNNFMVDAENQNDLTPRPVNCIPAGAVMMNVEALKRIKKPYFKFETEDLGQGRKGDRIILGEDSYFTRKALTSGIKSYIIPGISALHCDFKKSAELGRGYYYGPSWLVTADHQIQPDQVAKYCHFTQPFKKLYEAEQYDNSNVFGNLNPKLMNK